ncbi:MAG: hypothetical protein ACE5K7_05225 [Phycisphaerae bacterium]
MTSKQVIRLDQLGSQEVPAAFKAESYFDFHAHPFEHSSLLTTTKDVIQAIASIEQYARQWLGQTIQTRLADETTSKAVYRDSLPGGGQAHGHFEIVIESGAFFDPAAIIGSARQRNRIYVCAGARLIGAHLWPADGEIFIGPGTVVEPGAGIKGPAIIGHDNQLRQGAYLRGSVIIGNGGVFRGEIKNAVMMDGANFPHPSYVGDSLCGYKTHFGNQAGTANLGLFYPLGRKSNVIIELDGRLYDLGRPKVGIILGDYCQVGCNTVTAPGTFLGPHTVVYPLAPLPKGVRPAERLIKFKPDLQETRFDRTFGQHTT